MRSFVIDASVAVKWIFPEQTKEDHVPQAINLLLTIKQGSIKVIQPPHWLAEMAAVITRLQPEICENALNLLYALEFPIINDLETYQLACQLAERFKHHLFDTLYHAVALTQGAEFITADDNYYRKAYKQGALLRLANFDAFGDHSTNPKFLL